MQRNSVPLTVLGGIIIAPIFYILKEKLVKINIFHRLCCFVERSTWTWLCNG